MAVKKSRRKSATVKKTASRTKAQLEFDRHKAKYEAAQASRGSPFAPGQGSPMPPPLPQAAYYAYAPQEASYGPVRWGLPPSMAPLPAMPGAGAPIQGMPAGTVATAGSVGDRLGSTLRQGIEVLNAGLSGGMHFLGALSGAAYGNVPWGAPYAGGCGCGEPSHCHCQTYDCCDCCDAHSMDCCCQPSVGNCCC